MKKLIGFLVLVGLGVGFSVYGMDVLLEEEKGYTPQPVTELYFTLDKPEEKTSYFDEKKEISDDQRIVSGTVWTTNTPDNLDSYKEYGTVRISRQTYLDLTVNDWTEILILLLKKKGK